MVHRVAGGGAAEVGEAGAGDEAVGRVAVGEGRQHAAVGQQAGVRQFAAGRFGHGLERGAAGQGRHGQVVGAAVVGDTPQGPAGRVHLSEVRGAVVVDELDQSHGVRESHQIKVAHRTNRWDIFLIEICSLPIYDLEST